jgi:hypothetical protein
MQSDSPSSSLSPVIDALEAMCSEGIIDKYAIGGAFAAILHAEPISTVDLDIFFFFKEKQSGPILSLGPLYDFAKKNGFTFDSEFINVSGWLLQFVESSDNPLWADAVETASPILIEGRNVPVIDKEHLVASWLLAGRAKDFAKIAMFRSSGIIDDAKLRDVLGKHGLTAKWEKNEARFRDED